MTAEGLSLIQMTTELQELQAENARLRAQLAQCAVDRQQLQALNNLKDQFISRVSHDLRAPLSNLKLHEALLKRGNPEKRDEYQQVLAQQTARLERILDDLLDISRLDTGTTEFHFAPIDLNALLAEWSAAWRARASARGLKLQVEFGADLPLASADPTLLAQAVGHLIKNALDYTPPEGHIICRTALRPAAEQPWITLAIENSGPGLAEGEIEHMGERFYRGHMARQYKVDGTGLGLAICREIVVRHTGQLTVESNPGSSTTFTVWLRPDTTGIPNRQDS